MDGLSSETPVSLLTSAAGFAGTRADLASATGLLPAAYTDPDVHLAERERVFERAWVCVGLSADAVGGRLLVRTVGRRSIIITRDGSGVLRGFLNACRHRGTELAECDTDVGDTIRCPYHRWGYGLDGSLRATPHLDDVPRSGFEPDDHGLVPVRVETWGALLFACLSDDTMPLTDWLGDLRDRMAGYDLADWLPRHDQTLEIDADWKLISENFQEYYHLSWVHPELAKVSRVKDHYRYQGPGMYCGQTTTPVSGEDRDDWLALPAADGLDASDAVSGRFVAIFPNVLLSVLPNHAWVMRLDPTEAGRTVETCSLLVPPSNAAATDEAIAPTVEFWLHINGEDIDITQRSQRGLARGAVPPGPLVGRFEEPLHRFHNMWADHMTGNAVRVPDGDDPASDADRHGTAPNPTPPAIDQR